MKPQWMVAAAILWSAIGASADGQQTETYSTEVKIDLSEVQPLPQTTASFAPPEGCNEDQALATALGAVRACVQRFSATHEFAVVLKEYRFRPVENNITVSTEVAAMVADEHIARLRAANENQRGILLGLFEVAETPAQGRPTGADHCRIVSSVVIDRRVPGYLGEEFRIWGQIFVCARADSSNNSVQVVELRSSERFRVKTDKFKERFKYLEPLGSAMEAENSLTLF